MLPLRICAALVVPLWIAAMLWFNPPFELHKLIIWSISGVVFGLLWYRLMTMWFRRLGLWPRDLPHAEPGSPMAPQ